jgi:hypothetical protein
VDRVKALWDALPTATPAERLSFNRWLLAQEIEFRVHPSPPTGGDRLVSMLVEGRFAGMVPLAGQARQVAREQGMVEPAAAVAERLPDGSALVVLRPTDRPAPSAPRLRITEEHGARLVVLEGHRPLADFEPPDEGPWGLLWDPGLAQEGGVRSRAPNGLSG